MNGQPKTENFLGQCLQWLLALRYSIKIIGLDTLPLAVPCAPAESALGASVPEGNAAALEKNRPILFLPNHPALIDPFIVYSCIAGLRPRPLIDSRQLNKLTEIWAKHLGFISIPDMAKDGRAGLQGVRLGLNMLGSALEAGENALLYPSGRIYKSDKESIRSNSAVFKLLQRVPQTRVVLVRTTGLWGSRFSCAGGREPQFIRDLFRLIPAVLANAVFWLPRREVRVEFVEPVDFPRTESKEAINCYLENFYNETSTGPIYTKLYWWA